MYLLNVPSVSSPYFSKIKLASHLGKIAHLLARNSYVFHVEQYKIETESVSIFHDCTDRLRQGYNYDASVLKVGHSYKN